MRLMLPPERFILHVDATYKMNFRESPVLVAGVSDRSRGFYVVALFIVSQETQVVVQPALMSLKRLFFGSRVESFRPNSYWEMQISAVFGGCYGFKTLMCFFHVMKNVYEAIRGFPSGVTASIVHDMYDLHFPISESSYLRLRDRVVAKWLDDPGLHTFAQYMLSQWLTGRFTAWQLYLNPSGFASTNNPAETFNALLLHAQASPKNGALLKELRNYCEDQSSNPRPFRIKVVPAKTLTRRVSELVREKLLGTFEGVRFENLCAGQIQVYSHPAKRIIVAPNKRTEIVIAASAQMGANYARMEVEGSHGAAGFYFDSFGICIHVLFAIKSCDHVDSQGSEVLVCRKKHRARNTGGRPLIVGPALTF
ncbi:hypothetical protein PHPALM_30532 [Phytophthora palmivora]|uniref:MULE transposase domain-containing protein n=1 Tax=Phytophthora palmivora TaxID=4796 RepID=A0A2P4X4W3_9STRA|nr:hypothetical protein PHPALM_30532 [Phytophthora palmivora]